MASADIIPYLNAGSSHRRVRCARLTQRIRSSLRHHTGQSVLYTSANGGRPGAGVQRGEIAARTLAASATPAAGCSITMTGDGLETDTPGWSPKKVVAPVTMIAGTSATRPYWATAATERRPPR